MSVHAYRSNSFITKISEEGCILSVHKIECPNGAYSKPQWRRSITAEDLRDMQDGEVAVKRPYVAPETLLQHSRSWEIKIS